MKLPDGVEYNLSTHFFFLLTLSCVSRHIHEANMTSSYLNRQIHEANTVIVSVPPSDLSSAVLDVFFVYLKLQQ